MCDQAFRPEILDQFEPQDHPNDFAYPGGPPNRPYDLAGWTLAYQMGVKFDRELDGFHRSIREPIKTDLAKPLPGHDLRRKRHTGGLSGQPRIQRCLHPHQSSAEGQTTGLLDEGCQSPQATRQMRPGALWLPYSADTAQLLETATKTLGINAVAVAQRRPERPFSYIPSASDLLTSMAAPCPRAGSAGSSSSSNSPSRVVYPQELDAGNLNAKYDVLVFPDGSIRQPRRGGALDLHPGLDLALASRRRASWPA